MVRGIASGQYSGYMCGVCVIIAVGGPSLYFFRGIKYRGERAVECEVYKFPYTGIAVAVKKIEVVRVESDISEAYHYAGAVKCRGGMRVRGNRFGQPAELACRCHRWLGRTVGFQTVDA